MELRRLGSRGPLISVIGHGAWEAGSTEWGIGPPEDETVRAMLAAIDAGVNWIDTAEIYGGGHSEELVGRAIRDRPSVMVFTKVASAPRGTGYRTNDVRQAAEASLRRLGRDVIDLYQLHWLDEADVPLEETWGAMAALTDDGLVRWVGVSNVDQEALARCESVRHVDSLQPQLSMLWQQRKPLLPVCAANGTGVIAYGPLAFGLLTGSITRDTTFKDDDWRSGSKGLRAYGQLFAQRRLDANLDVVDALKPIAERKKASLPQVALSWVLHQDGITGAIAGSRSPQHVRENAQAVAVRLSDSDLEEIEELLRRRGELLHPDG